ncbi:MAG: hypothetical protein IKJ28_03955 [Alphaproteobacteria bacterium]|nr:hypothetical protein [Alphaproteobacteria bacterium]
MTKEQSVCAGSTLFLIYRLPEFISGSCDDNGTLFLPLLSENLKQVQIDDGYKGLLSF